MTGVPFNDAYRYMDWLLTVPLLLIEILLAMKLDEATFNSKAWVLGVGSAMMIASGYYGDLVGTSGYHSDHDGLFRKRELGISLGNEGTSFDGCPFQRCLFLHGLTSDSDLVVQ